MDGIHNGGVINSFNLAVYSYTYQNPIRLIDPNGKQVDIVNPIGSQIVQNYNNSSNKMPGGLCYVVSKQRFATAFEQVMDQSVNSGLPSDSGKGGNTPKLTYDILFNSATGNYRGWTSIPVEFRGKGGAGALANAGFGELKNQEQIWNGELTPGAIVQTFGTQEEFNDVVSGDSNAYGHSFIFLNYERDVNGAIIGMNIADQGYQSDNYITESYYGVWNAANITIEPREEITPITIKPKGIELAPVSIPTIPIIIDN